MLRALRPRRPGNRRLKPGPAAHIGNRRIDATALDRSDRPSRHQESAVFGCGSGSALHDLSMATLSMAPDQVHPASHADPRRHCTGRPLARCLCSGPFPAAPGPNPPCQLSRQRALQRLLRERVGRLPVVDAVVAGRAHDQCLAPYLDHELRPQRLWLPRSGEVGELGYLVHSHVGSLLT
jgi:hypothetical protein